MNDLNAQQIVLLTLLVSFVTSIATGITTVSLLEQAPEPVTQTINRVVEKTVERVVPQEDNDSNVTVQDTREKEIVTVVVKEEDLTIDSVEKNSKSIVRIYEKGNNSEQFIGLGIVFDGSGRVVTDSLNIQKNRQYAGVYQSGKFNLDVTYKESNDRYAILKIKDGESQGSFAAATFADSQNLKLAQSVISLSGQTSNTVSTGIITGLVTDSGALNDSDVNATTEPQKSIQTINTSVSSNNVLIGSVLLNLSGEIIGARINSDASNLTAFTPSNSIQAFLAGK